MLKETEKVQVPYLHEVWTWQGDTSVLPFKVVEILNSVSVFKEEDFPIDDPFESLERPFKSDDMKLKIDNLIQ